MRNGIEQTCLQNTSTAVRPSGRPPVFLDSGAHLFRKSTPGSRNSTIYTKNETPRKPEGNATCRFRCARRIGKTSSAGAFKKKMLFARFLRPYFFKGLQRPTFFNTNDAPGAASSFGFGPLEHGFGRPEAESVDSA